MVVVDSDGEAFWSLDNRSWAVVGFTSETAVPVGNLISATFQILLIKAK
jgi:hypothetical protein